jgi:hypothetical protein
LILFPPPLDLHHSWIIFHIIQPSQSWSSYFSSPFWLLSKIFLQLFIGPFWSRVPTIPAVYFLYLLPSQELNVAPSILHFF